MSARATALNSPLMPSAFAAMTTATAGSSEKRGARMLPGTSRNCGNTESISSSPSDSPVDSLMPPMTSVLSTSDTSA